MCTLMEEEEDNNNNEHYSDEYENSFGKIYFEDDDENEDDENSSSGASNNLLVTFDYGYIGDSIEDSIEATRNNGFVIEPHNAKLIELSGLQVRVVESEENSLANSECNFATYTKENDGNSYEDLWYLTAPRPHTRESIENIAKAFQVHHVTYNENEIGLGAGESALSLSYLPEYGVDVDAGDVNDDHEDDDASRIYASNVSSSLKINEIEEEFYDSIECAYTS